MIKVIRKATLNDIQSCAKLLEIAFPHAYTVDEAMTEIEDLVNNQVVLVYDLENTVVGFIGAIEQYKGFTYELHPLVVDKAYQYQGIGKQLVDTLEQSLVSRGIYNVYLGTDDEFFQTSLSDKPIDGDLFESIKTIKNYRKHPYEFYLKQGFKIVGVIPDANGECKPDIIMAKKLKR